MKNKNVQVWQLFMLPSGKKRVLVLVFDTNRKDGERVRHCTVLPVEIDVDSRFVGDFLAKVLTSKSGLTWSVAIVLDQSGRFPLNLLEKEEPWGILVNKNLLTSIQNEIRLCKKAQADLLRLQKGDGLDDKDLVGVTRFLPARNEQGVVDRREELLRGFKRAIATANCLE